MRRESSSHQETMERIKTRDSHQGSWISPTNSDGNTAKSNASANGLVQYLSDVAQ